MAKTRQSLRLHIKHLTGNPMYKDARGLVGFFLKSSDEKCPAKLNEFQFVVYTAIKVFETIPQFSCLIGNF